MTMALGFGYTDHFRVELFGGPRLYHDDEEISLSRHQRWLLAALYGSETRALPRVTILGWFWPGEDPPRSRRRLNQLLYSFRKKVPGEGIFKAQKEDVLPPDSSVSCDLLDYRSSLESLDFSSAQSILRRGFAPLIVADAPKAFHDWIVARSAEFGQNLSNGARVAWHRASEREEWEEAVGPALALLEWAPTDERNLRAAVESLVRAGRKDEAESILLETGRAIHGDAWSPSDELQRLLSIPDLAPKFGAPPDAHLSGAPKPPPLQGRNQERNLLRRTLGNPPGGELRGILVSGEAGIGKTRLIQEAIRSIPLDGHRVLLGEAAELEQIIPLNPLIEMFRPDWIGELLGDLEEPWRTVLFGVMPGHYPGIGPVPDAPHIQPGSVPRRLFEAFYQLLLALVESGPTILVLEDLQWADETTLSILEFLIRRWESGQLQLLISVRGDEVRRSATLATFLENLRIHVDFLEINLTDLEPTDSEALIRHITADPLSQQDVDGLKSLAGGNPFFLIELTFEFLAGRLAVPTEPRDPVQVPLSIRQVLDRRFAQLSPEADRVLGALAVFSRALQVEALKEITQLSGHQCLSGLDQLHRFRLVQNAGTAVTISHELVRHTVYQNLSDTHRAWLHDQVGRHLSTSGDPIPADELAVHFHHAGATEKAQVYATEAADRAEASGAVAEALRFLRIARKHATDPEAVADLIHRMGHLHYLHQNLEEAAPLLELAAQRFRRQGKTAQALDAEVERIDCLAQRGLIPFGDCYQELLGIRESAKAAEEWEIFAKALDIESRRADHLGQVGRIETALEEARFCKDRNGPNTKCRARAVLALNVYHGDPLVGLTSAREAVKISLTTDDTDLQLHAINRLIVVMLYQGLLNSPEGEELFGLAEERLNSSGDLNLKFFVRLNKAVWHLEAGELDKADRAFARVYPVIRGTKAEEAHTIFHLNLGELRLSQFDYEGALAEYKAAEAFLQPHSSKTFRSVMNAGLGQCALAQGDLLQAREREALLGPMPTKWTFDPSVVATFKAHMYKRRGNPDEADRFLRSVAANIEGRLITPWIRLCLLRAKLLTKLDRAKAQPILKRVAQASERLNLPETQRAAQRLLGV